jgi:hypothetical protein
LIRGPELPEAIWKEAAEVPVLAATKASVASLVVLSPAVCVVAVTPFGSAGVPERLPAVPEVFPVEFIKVPEVGRVTFVAAVTVKVVANAPEVARFPPRVIVLPELFTPVPP